MYARILVPVDGSPPSDRGLAHAVELARATGARLKLLHVLDAQALARHSMSGLTPSPDVWGLLREGGEAIVAAARRAAEAAGVPADTELAEGLAQRVSDVIVEAARSWPADLIVLGTHGRRGLGRLVLGSDAEQVVRLAPVPVLLVRAAAPAA